MFEVLMFIVENYMENSTTLRADTSIIEADLERIGFYREEIDRALEWLDGLDKFKKGVETNTSLKSHALRHYMPEESALLGTKGRGFLLYLERIGILDPITREIVIDRIMALMEKPVSMGRIRWVILLVLFSQPDKKSALSMLQDMILSDAFDVLH